MNDLARTNGWRGFEGLAEHVERIPGIKDSKTGWQYRCDGMPSMFGCPATIVIPVQWKKVGLKSTGWLVCYGMEPNTIDAPFDDLSQWHEDHDVVLTFCPSCADIVMKQDKKRQKEKDARGL